MAVGYSNSHFEKFREDGPLLWARKWTEEDDNSKEIERKALLFLSHGLGEHSGCYNELGTFLSRLGILVFSHDHIGHGKSSGIHNHVGDFKEYTIPIFDHCDQMKKKYPDLPLFMFGHSMGGAMAILAGLEKPDYFTGIITSGPFVIPSRGFPSKCEMFFLKYIVAKVFPQRVLFQIDPNEVSRDPKIVEKIKNDPLFHSAFKAGLGKAWLDCSAKIQENIKLVSWPFLALHGDADPISDVKFSQTLYDEAPGQDKELKVYIYPGFLHHPVFEPEEDRKQVFNDIKQWLEERM